MRGCALTSIGELLHPDHIRDFDVLPADARRITLSFDTATKTTESASYTVCLVIASDGRRHYVIDVVRQRLDPVQARDAAVRLIQHYKPNQILIEDASSGPGLGQMLGELGHRSELRSTRGRGKEDRFEAHLHVFVDGRILVKRDQVWTTALVDEWLRFPFARYDDQVDAMSQYLEWVSDHRLVTRYCAGQAGRMSVPHAHCGDRLRAKASIRCGRAAAGANPPGALGLDRNFDRARGR